MEVELVRQKLGLLRTVAVHDLVLQTIGEFYLKGDEGPCTFKINEGRDPKLSVVIP